MPASDMILAGAIDAYTAAYQRCRDSSLARSCYDYAQRRLEKLFPSESNISIQAVANQGREAVSRGQRINRNSSAYVNTTWSPLDPAETVRRSRGGRPLIYVYGVSVTVTTRDSKGVAGALTRSIVVINDRPMPKSEIESKAIQEMERLAKVWETNSDRLAGRTLDPTYSVRVESAYRSRD